jgi:alkanesulfonate monooxygenase SsuD/methylene tetrahydromethanopterin reductase-like flavin-dependent oxidoreductase (luciferase family)
LKFSFFHLMPYTHLELEPHEWPFPNRYFDAAKASALYRTYVDSMIHAESCGFDWVGCNEHHFSPYGMMANPNLIGGALAYSTKRSKIAITGNLVPLNNPIRVAEEYAMLDCMTGGRLVAGLMRGIPHEYLAYNIPPGESWERQREAVHLILKAWTEPEPFGWEGKHFQYRQVSIWPKPMQKPHPPLLISASNADSAKFAAEMRATMGMVLLADLPSGKDCIRIYKEAARASGWEPAPENILVGMHTCIAETDKEARRWLGQGLKYFDEVLMGGLQLSQRIVLQKTRYFESDESRDRWKSRLDKRRTLTLDEQIERGTVLCGSPETVVKQIKRIHAELGHGVFNFTVKVGTLPDDVIRNGMELFRDRVLPHVRDL